MVEPMLTELTAKEGALMANRKWTLEGRLPMLGGDYCYGKQLRVGERVEVVEASVAEGLVKGLGSLLWVMNNRHNWADPRWDDLAEAAENDARAALVEYETTEEET